MSRNNLSEAFIASQSRIYLNEDLDMSQVQFDGSEERKEDQSKSRSNESYQNGQVNLQLKIDDSVKVGFDLLITATVNKLCQEYELFLSQNNSIINNLEGQMLRFDGPLKVEKFIDDLDRIFKNDSRKKYENIDLDEEEKEENIFMYIIKRASKKYSFLSILLCFVVICALGPLAAIFFGFFAFRKKSQADKGVKVITVISGIVLSLISGFFYFCLILLLKQELQGVFLDAAIVGILQLFMSCVQFVLFCILNQKSESKLEEFKYLVVSPDLLFFEMIDRSNFKDQFIRESPLQQDVFEFLSQVPQYPNKSLQQQSHIIQEKVWYTGYFMLYDFSSFFSYKSKVQKFNNGFMLVINALLSLGLLIVPIIFFCLDLKHQGSEYIFELVTFIVLILFSLTINLLVHLFNFLFMDNFYTNIVALTVLIEPRNKISQFNLQKNIPTINLFCTQTIQTWKQVREICLNVTHKYFIVINQIHITDIIFVILIFTTLILDYKGIIWSEKYIINSRFLLSYFCMSIIQKVFCSLIYTFNHFSSMNQFLKYNLEQIYLTYQKLLYFQSSYFFLRQSAQSYITELLEKRKIDLKTLQTENQFIEAIEQVQKIRFKPYSRKTPHISEITRDDMQLQSIFNIKSLFEIKRNTLYYLEGSAEINEEDTTKIIKLEKEYLQNLISVYKNIIDDMKFHEKKYLIKFLGLIPLEYGKLYALLTILIPALISFFIKDFINN